MTSLTPAAKGMLAIRSSFGTTYVLSPTSAPVKAGFPKRELTASARFFAAVFGVREFLMVGMVLKAAKTDRTTLRSALAASAAIDAFDAVAAASLAATDARARKAGVMSAVTAALSGTLAGIAAAQV